MTGQQREEVPATEPVDEPVYVETVSPHYFRSVDDAAVAVWDDGGDPSTVKAHPCDVGRAHTPDIEEYVTETWSEGFEDPGCWDVEVPEPLATELADFQRRLAEAAPIVWTPRLKETVALPAVDCPDCGTASNEPWDDLRPPCGYCGRPADRDVLVSGGTQEGAS